MGFKRLELALLGSWVQDMCTKHNDKMDILVCDWEKTFKQVAVNLPG